MDAVFIIFTDVDPLFLFPLEQPGVLSILFFSCLAIMRMCGPVMHCSLYVPDVTRPRCASTHLGMMASRTSFHPFGWIYVPALMERTAVLRIFRSGGVTSAHMAGFISCPDATHGRCAHVRPNGIVVHYLLHR